MDNSTVKTKFENSIKYLETNLQSISATGTSPSLLNRIVVNYYEVMTPLPQLASITSPEANQLLVTTFDKTKDHIKDVEDAIRKAELGIGINNQGDKIIISVPAVTEEKRLLLTKEVSKLGEQTKISIRNERQSFLKLIKASEESDDWKKNEENNLQKLVTEFNSKIDLIVKDKEQSLLKI